MEILIGMFWEYDRMLWSNLDSDDDYSDSESISQV